MNRQTKRILGGTAATLAVLAGCGGRGGEKDYRQALELWRSGDLVRAESRLEKAARKLVDAEKKSRANNQLKILLCELGRYDEAAERFAESERLVSDDTATLNRGVALCYAGRLEQARFDLEKRLMERPDDLVARGFSAWLRMRSGAWEKAERDLANMVRGNPQDLALQNALALAEANGRAGKDAAIRRLGAIAAAYPPAAYNLALLHETGTGEKAEALRWYRTYLEVAGAQAFKAEAAQRAVERLQRPATRRSISGTAGGHVDHLARGTRLYAAKRYDEAVAEFEKAANAGASKPKAYYNMGLSLYAKGAYARAVGAFADALRFDSANADARYMLSLSYAKQGRWADAEREARRLAGEDASRSETLLEYVGRARNAR